MALSNLFKISVPDETSANDVPVHLLSVVNQIEQNFAGSASGTHAQRPTASIPNRLYWETDTGILFRDTGTGWISVSPVPATTGDTTTAGWADTPTEGITGRTAAADHRHGMPANPVNAHVQASNPHAQYLLSTVFTGAKGIVVLGTGLNTYGTEVPTSDGQMLISDSTRITGARWAGNPILTSYTEKFDSVSATTSTTVLDMSTATNKFVTLNVSTGFTFINVPPIGSGKVFRVNVRVIHAVAGTTISFPGGTRWTSRVMPTYPNAVNTINTWVLETWDGGSSWDGYLAGRDMG